MKRRDILRTAGAGLAGAAAAGVAGADSTASARRVGRRPSPRALRAALADNRDLLAELAADGVVETASVDEFEVERHRLPGTGDGAAFTAATVDGVQTALPSVSRTVDGGHLVVSVLPADGRAFAVLRRDGGGTATYGTLDVEPASHNCPDDCQWVCDCVDWCCIEGRCECCDENCACIC